MARQTYDRRYWRKARQRQGLTPAEYIKRSQRLFVVLIDGIYPETWDEDGSPRLFDSFMEAEKWCLPEDTVITEYAFIQTFCN